MMFCIEHRFEGDHGCLGLQAAEEAKKEVEAPKMRILDKIKARAMSSQTAMGKAGNQEKQAKINRIVQRIKIK